MMSKAAAAATVKSKEVAVKEKVAAVGEEDSTAPKTMYEFEGKDYSKEICSDKDKEKFDIILKTNVNIANKNEEDEELVTTTRKKREIVKLSDEEIAARAQKRKLDEEKAKVAKKQKLEEQQKRREESLKDKWKKAGYQSTKLDYDEDEEKEKEDDDDGKSSTLDLLDDEDNDNKYINYVKGDVTMPKYANNKNAIIVHCVDNSGNWGRGGLFDANIKT